MTVDVSVTFEPGNVRPIPYTTTFEPAPSGLTATPVGTGGTFAAGTYYWVVTGTDAYGETTGSNEATAVIVLNGSANLAWNALPPGTTGVKVYRGTSPGGENALIATLGAVTAYTDTGTAGSGATPPSTNTAAIGDTTILGGGGWFWGWSLRETSGSNPCTLEVRDGDVLITEINILAGGTSSEWYGSSATTLAQGVRVHIVSGKATGTIFVVPYYG